MVNYFLNKKILFFCFLSFLSLYSLYSKVKYNSEEIEKIRYQFLTGQNINIEEYELFLDSFIKDADLSDDNNLIYLLDCFHLYSNIQIIHLTENSMKRIKDFDELLFPLIQKSKNSEVINEYASYLYSKISWSKNSFSIIEELPYWYKKSMQLNNLTAELFYSAWLINAVKAKESNWISYIKQKEYLLDELKIQKKDFFALYLSYSIFYMKIHDIKKGFEYLSKAEKLYPNNYECALLEINYKNGRMGW